MQLWPATETSWVVLYGGQTIPKWRTAAILKIGILSPYLSEKSSDFHEILYKAADFELDERHVIKDEKNCNGQTPSSTARISCFFLNFVNFHFFAFQYASTHMQQACKSVAYCLFDKWPNYINSYSYYKTRRMQA